MKCKKPPSEQVKNSPVLCFDLDIDQRKLFLSEECFRIYHLEGFHNGDDARKIVSAVKVEKSSMPAFFRFCRNVLRDYRSGHAELWMLSKGGKKYIRTVIQWGKIIDAGGRPIRVVGTGEAPGRNATERREIDLHEEIEGLRMQIEQQKVYLERAEEYQSELRRYRHDRKNNMISLFGILENGDVEGAKAYIQDIVGILNQHSSIINTGNPAFDALITEKLDEAEKAGIEVDQIVGLPRDLGINRKDLCLSVGSCMDNAIEACMRAKAAGLKPYIQFQLVEVKGIIVLKMDNATPDADSEGLEQLSTNKEDKINHGFGLQNIRSVVDKYHGYMDAAIHDHMFSLTFTLPVE